MWSVQALREGKLLELCKYLNPRPLGARGALSQLSEVNDLAVKDGVGVPLSLLP